MGPVGGQQPRAPLPAPDASPAVAFPLSATRSSSQLGSHPLCFHPSTRRATVPPHTHPATVPPRTHPQRHRTQPHTAARCRELAWEDRSRHSAASPAPPSQLTLASVLPAKSSLRSCPLHDSNPFHHWRERPKPGTRKKCRLLCGPLSASSPLVPTELAWAWPK